MPEGIRDKAVILGMGCARFGERWEAGPEELMLEAKDGNESAFSELRRAERGQIGAAPVYGAPVAEYPGNPG